MSGVVMRCVGRTDGTVAGREQGAYLQRFDVEFGGGLGWARWTTDPREALLFEDVQAAHAAWMTVPRCKPRRDDGKPNRPLTLFTIRVEPAP